MVFIYTTNNVIMKTTKIFFAAFVTFLSLHVAAYSQTQTAMNRQAGTQYQKADQELNSVYQKILKEYAKQSVFIAKLKTAQRLWVQLRDAELEARYPEPNQYGSALPTCRAIYLKEMTQQRTNFLRTWLTGIPEGDVCNGSVKIKR